MSKKLVAYFSCSGVTKSVAELLAKEYNATLYEIKPKVPYTNADLDWTDEKARSTIEMKDKKSRPEMADKNAGVENYDVILLCFPIWWYIAPTIVNTFLESYNFKGKKIVVFATSGSSGFGETVKYLKGSVDASTVIEEGKLTHGKVSQAEVSKWAKSLKI